MMRSAAKPAGIVAAYRGGRPLGAVADKTGILNRRRSSIRRVTSDARYDCPLSLARGITQNELIKVARGAMLM